MLMDAVLAVALGLVPVEDSPGSTKVHVREPQLVKDYSQRIDGRGKVHLRGIDPRSGRTFYVTVSKTGNVKGWVGDRYVIFHASSAG